jgi:hypothetical protein
MNKTLYIRDEDIQTWERARELAGEKLSPVIITGLKRFIVEKEAEEAEAKGYKRIEVSYNDAETHNVPRRKAFHGKWVYSPEKCLEFSTEDGYTSYHYALALTAKGNVVVLTWNNDAEGNDYNSHFYVFPSLEAAAENTEANLVARAAMKKLGVPVEELDI